MGRRRENWSPRSGRPAIRQRWHIRALLTARVVAASALLVAAPRVLVAGTSTHDRDATRRVRTADAGRGILTADAASGMRIAEAADASAAAPAVRVYIDPATGQPIAPPSGTLPPEEGSRSVLPSTARELQNTGPAGGFMLDTKTSTFDIEATIDPAGTPKVHCDPPSPAGK